MASLYIAEFGDPRLGTQGLAGVVAMPPIAEQKLAISGTHNPSAAFNIATKRIKVHTDAICSIAVGGTPVATAANMRLEAGHNEYFEVTPGHKISVISNT